MDALLDQSNSGPRVAVIFRTHFWDAFAARQFQRLTQKVGGGDVYVLVDETNGPVEGIPHDKVVRMTETDVLALGFPTRRQGQPTLVQWGLPALLLHQRAWVSTTIMSCLNTTWR